MEITSHAFKENAKTALGDTQLQLALTGLVSGDSLVTRRASARARLPEFEALRDIGRDIKNHPLANLDLYLDAWEAKAKAAGANVHWAPTGADARAVILDICRKANAKIVTKGKSMISEEVGLNAHLQAAGMEVVETDLGEYLVQIRKETPSHIIAPAIHLTQQQVEQDFRRLHTHLAPDRVLSEASQLVDEARQILRSKFVNADVGITGANFLIAETGSSVIVTNEGNGDLTQSLAKTHIVIASIDKVVPTFEDVSTLIRLLARSATGQEISTYTTFSTGPRLPGDPDGPENYHVVVLDNGRSALLGTPFREALRCIRCGACMNHCPVYRNIGGHAYGWVYPGPMGSVLTPSFVGLENAIDLPNASTFCGECAVVCPVKIPLPDLMRHLRHQQVVRHLRPLTERVALRLWSWAARHPAVYALFTRAAVRLLGWMGGKEKRLHYLPGASGWTKGRDMPAPSGRTFRELYQARRSS